MTSLKTRMTSLTTLNPGPDEYENGRRARSIDDTGRRLLMVLQSHPETRREISYNTDYVTEEYSWYMDDTPVPDDNPNISPYITRIRPAPVIPKQALLSEACLRIDPETWARNNAIREPLQQRFDAEDRLTSASEARPRQEYFAAKEDLYVFDSRDGIAADINPNLLPDMLETVYREYHEQHAKPILAMLESVGIEGRFSRAGSKERREYAIDCDAQKLEAAMPKLMELHRDAILERYKDVEFVITTAPNTPLDSEQAARAIANAQQALQAEYEAQKDAIATLGETLGVGWQADAFAGKTSPSSHAKKAR